MKNLKDLIRIALVVLIVCTAISINNLIVYYNTLEYYSMPSIDWYWKQIEPQLDADQATLVKLLNKEVLKNGRTTDGHLDIQDVHDIQQFIHSQIKSYDRNYTVMETIHERRGDCSEKAFLQYQLLQAENLDNQSRVYIVLLLMETPETSWRGQTTNHASSLIMFNDSFIYSDPMLFDTTWYLNMTNIFNLSYNCEDFGITQMHLFAMFPIERYEIGFLLSDFDSVRFIEEERLDDNFHVCKWIEKQYR